MKESAKRLQGVQKLLESNAVDIAAIGPTNHMRYLLGNAPHADERLCLLFVGRDRLQMVAPKLNAEEIASYTDIEIISWDDADGPNAALEASIVREKKIKKLAVDGAMRADFLLPLLTISQPEEIVPADPTISLLRMRKSPDEIEALARAAEQADRAMQAAISACRSGVTEKEVAWEAEKAFRKEGAEEVSFTLVAAGSNGAHPHHHSGEKVLARGEAVVIDIGASLNGFKSDITRTIYLGQPTEEFRRIYEIVLEANERGRLAVRPGVPAGEIDAVTRNYIEEAGYGDYFTHRTGHGLGLDIHEPPWIMKGNDEILAPGMVFSVEPGIYLEGRFGVRIEDIVVVNENGVQTLTGYDRRLIAKEE